jgi:hypothetical protein
MIAIVRLSNVEPPEPIRESSIKAVLHRDRDATPRPARSTELCGEKPCGGAALRRVAQSVENQARIVEFACRNVQK